MKLFDAIKLRSSTVYQAQAEIKPLQIVYGDLTASRISCLQIDSAGLLFHASDRPMQVITGIYDSDGQELTAGVTAYSAYKDETGHAIACIKFDRPQPGKTFSVAGKGVEDDTGALITLPADFFKDIILNVQGYDASAIDSADLARFYSDCLASGIAIAFVLGATVTLKQLFDELSLNIHAFSMLSNGKTVFRLKGTGATIAAQYDFLQADITGFRLTSGELINEITARFAWNFADNKAMESITKHAPLSKVLYGDAKKSIDLRFIHGVRQADRFCDAILATSASPEIKTSFTHDLRSFRVEVGDTVSVTHIAGLADAGWVAALAMVTKKQLAGVEIRYEVAMAPTNNLSRAELVSLSVSGGLQELATEVSVKDGVTTIIVTGGVSGARITGAEVIINGQRMVTDDKGRIETTLPAGQYTVSVSAPGYKKTGTTFKVAAAAAPVDKNAEEIAKLKQQLEALSRIKPTAAADCGAWSFDGNEFGIEIAFSGTTLTALVQTDILGLPCGGAIALTDFLLDGVTPAELLFGETDLMFTEGDETGSIFWEITDGLLAISIADWSFNIERPSVAFELTFQDNEGNTHFLTINVTLIAA